MLSTRIQHERQPAEVEQVPQAIDALRRAFGGDLNAVVNTYVETRGALIRDRLLDLYRRMVDDVVERTSGAERGQELAALQRTFLQEVGKFERLMADEMKAEVVRQEQGLWDPDAHESVRHLLGNRVQQIGRELRTAAFEESIRAHLR